MENEDIALATFIEIAATHAPDLPKELLLKIYDIQKIHQFDDEKDRASPTREMGKLVEDFVDKILSKEEK
jgi:hypothetical protein